MSPHSPSQPETASQGLIFCHSAGMSDERASIELSKQEREGTCRRKYNHNDSRLRNHADARLPQQRARQFRKAEDEFRTSASK